MGIEIILKVAGIGILVAIACQLLKQSGRDDIAMITGHAGLVLSLMLILSYVGSLFNTVIQIFGL